MRPAIVLAWCVAACVSAQTAPVTRGEVHAATARMETLVREVLRLPAGSAPAPAKPDEAASRAEITQALARLFRVAEPKFVYTPRPQKFDASRVRKLPVAADQAALEKLIRWGGVAPYGPLATNSGGLTPKELGDALGFCVARLAELTHTPSSKFSPGLMRN